MPNPRIIWRSAYEQKRFYPTDVCFTTVAALVLAYVPPVQAQTEAQAEAAAEDTSMLYTTILERAVC